MRALYEINADIEQVVGEYVDMETGEISNVEEFEEIMESLQVERQEKLEAVALWMKNLGAEAEMLKKEEESFRKRRQACENQREGLKKYLAFALNGQKMKTAKVNIYYGTSTGTVITDAGKIPERFIVPQEPKYDLNAIKAELKAGREVEGAELSTNQYIVVR